MSDWIMRCGELLAPLYDKLTKTLLSQAVIHSVIKEDKKKQLHVGLLLRY